MARIRTIKPEAPRYRKKTISGAVKVEVVSRYGAEPGSRSPANCHYCGASGGIWWPLTYAGKVRLHVGLIDLEFDHVYPESKGGPSTPENLVLACRPCNRSKKDKVL